MARPKKIPSYLEHKSSGQARVIIDGKTIYLGPYQSPQSYERYELEIARWRKRQGPARATEPLRRPSIRTVDDLLAAWSDHAEQRYARPGGAAKERLAYRYALRPVHLLCGSWNLEDFGPLALAQVRDVLASGYDDPEHGTRRPSCRRVVNRHLVRIRTVWRWAESMELVPAGSWARLRTLPGLARGDALAVDRPRVAPVPDEQVDAVLAAAGGVTEALGAVLYWTGARPGELFGLRVGQVDCSGPVWRAVLHRHKTAHLGRPRVIHFGPHAQRWLAPLLEKPAGALVFANRNGHAFTVHTLRQNIVRAAGRAGVPAFSPYRLRHSAATRFKDACGWEGARLLLGHAGVSMTAHYAEDSAAKAADAAARAG